uniref:Uncharacterized protein n=1 Tax=Kalanchoe fedtschenkoi TaxID=63787 RepID=A0A7N0VA72_KALFE
MIAPDSSVVPSIVSQLIKRSVEWGYLYRRSFRRGRVSTKTTQYYISSIGFAARQTKNSRSSAASGKPPALQYHVLLLNQSGSKVESPLTTTTVDRFRNRVLILEALQFIIVAQFLLLGTPQIQGFPFVSNCGRY